MATNRIDERHRKAVGVPELVGRLDEVTAYGLRSLAEDSKLSPEDAQRERNRIIGERRRNQAAERARRRAAVELLSQDVAVAMRRP